MTRETRLQMALEEICRVVTNVRNGNIKPSCGIYEMIAQEALTDEKCDVNYREKDKINMDKFKILLKQIIDNSKSINDEQCIVSSDIIINCREYYTELSSQNNPIDEAFERWASDKMFSTNADKDLAYLAWQTAIKSAEIIVGTIGTGSWQGSKIGIIHP